jgi:hypothetical protein
LDDVYIINKKTGKKRLKQTTKGWELCVTWNDGSTAWVPLKELKDANPVEVAD